MSANASSIWIWPRDPGARRDTDAPEEEETKTPWLELDDVFYEARGHTWALIHLLRAMERDFGDVLDNKNARVSLQQIIRELEPTQDALWSPMVLNGDGLRTAGESFAGDGVVHLAGECGDHRPQVAARAGIDSGDLSEGGSGKSASKALWDPLRGLLEGQRSNRTRPRPASCLPTH